MDARRSMLMLDDGADERNSRASSSVSNEVSTADGDAISIDVYIQFVGQPMPSAVPLPFGISGVKDAFSAKVSSLSLPQHGSKLQDGDKEPKKRLSLVQCLASALGEPSADCTSDPDFGLQSVDDVDVASQGSFEHACRLACATRAGKFMQRQYQKTKLCRFYAKERCYLGDDCLYAHTSDELQALPSLRKTKLCNRFFRHQCLEKDCKFAHSYQELRSTDALYKTSFCRWFAQNACKAGADCRYAHSIADLRDGAHQRQ